MSLPVSIDTLKSTINRRGGVARGNRFAVYVSHPSKGMNSLLNFNPANLLSNLISGQGVRIGDFIQDPRDIFLLCQSCTMPGKRIMTTEATHNHHNTKKPYSAATDEVTMTFLMTNDYYMKKYFDMWQEMIIDTSHEHYKAFYKREYCSDVSIQQLSASNDVVPGYTVKLENAYPIQVGALELGNSADGLMELSITWEYDNFRTVNMVDGFEDVVGRMLGIGRDTLSTFDRLF
jgi:hypothetical protein|tara:strand:+ start:5104 stop:5802 length:699 start_codon:yes stop_codon:yes gene_type:complete